MAINFFKSASFPSILYFCSFRRSYKFSFKVNKRVKMLRRLNFLLFFFCYKNPLQRGVNLFFQFQIFKSIDSVMLKLYQITSFVNYDFILSHFRLFFFYVINFHQLAEKSLFFYSKITQKELTVFKTSFVNQSRIRLLTVGEDFCKIVKFNNRLLTFPLIARRMFKYYFFSKFFFNGFSVWFRSNASTFTTKFKKRLSLQFYQGVQSSHGYTNSQFLFLNSFFTKTFKFSSSKLASYSRPQRNSLFKKRVFLFNPLPARTDLLMVNSEFFFKFSGIQFILNFFFKPLFLKFFFFFFKSAVAPFLTPKFVFKSIQTFVPVSKQVNRASNFFALDKFSFFFKKYFLYIAAHNKYDYRFTYIFQLSVSRFIRFCSGKSSYFKVFPFLSTILSLKESTRCSLWAQKVKYYRKVLGPKLFLNESLQILYICIKYKDINLFSEWATSMFYKISFWKYKTFLRYIKYLLRYFFLGIYRELEFKGMKYQLKGKISVAGNSRTRTSYHYVGFTSHSTFNNKILHRLNLVRTFTGVLGFKIWFVF